MKTLEERFWAKVKKTKTCWLWTGAQFTTGYGKIRVGLKEGYAHRVCWELVKGPIPEGLLLDHVCHTPTCVNPVHLRLATHAENGQNQKKSSRNTSGFKGVTLDKATGKWLAQIGKAKKLGRFNTPEEAHQAYCKAASKLYGEFANFGEVL